MCEETINPKTAACRLPDIWTRAPGTLVLLKFKCVVN